MQSEDIKVAICDDEEFYRSQLDDMVSVYGNRHSDWMHLTMS